MARSAVSRDRPRDVRRSVGIACSSLLAFGLLVGSCGRGGASYAYYFANSDSRTDCGQIYGVAKGATSIALLVTSPCPFYVGDALTFDDAALYYAVVHYGYSETSLIAFDATSHRTRTIVFGLDQVFALVADATSLYFASAPWGSDQTIIGKVPLVGGPVQILASRARLGYHLARRPLAVDQSYLFWTEPSQGSVLRVPVVGGAVETVAEAQVNPDAIAADSTGIYWVNRGHPGIDCQPIDGTLMLLKHGSDAPLTLASNLWGVSSIAVKDGRPYWTTWGPGCPFPFSGGLYTLDLGSGLVRTLASPLRFAGSLFVDATTAYFLEGDPPGPSAVRR